MKTALSRNTEPSHATDSANEISDTEVVMESVWDSDGTIAMVGSMQVHIIIFLTLALFQLQSPIDDEAVVIVSTPPEYEEKIEMIEEIVVSETPQTAIGSDAMAELDMAQASAEVFAEVADIPNPVDLQPTDLGQIMVNRLFNQPVAPQKRLETRKGSTGTGTAGAAGAVDQITFEIMQAAEERPTLVVWLFDQSGSLTRQRSDIRERFNRIYEELGILNDGKAEANAPREEARVLTSIIGFGEKVDLYTEEPTADLSEIQSIVSKIPVDNSGVERVFTAVEAAAKEYKPLRRNIGPRGPKRNVLFVVVTDERGDDGMRLETSIDSCRKLGIPVYVIGVPAPFGQEHTLVKYVDPDPKYDQTPAWAQVDQGPETLLPERLQLSFTGNFEQEPVIDSGFGPYGLTRLCYETGGIYFTVHPSRNVSREVRRNEIEAFTSDMRYFFDPSAMVRYRPDYVSQQDYITAVKNSPLRAALVKAAAIPNVDGIQRPRTRFVKTNEAQLAGDLTKAQQDAAPLEPKLLQMALTLEQGLPGREDETSPRWLAGFDLAYGRVLAQKVRTETYNAVLAQAKRGMPFKDKKNNTWILVPSDEINVGSKWQREADKAREYLTGVIEQHPDTPWALLATKELEAPIGWKWTEEFTAPKPPREPGPGNNNNNPAPNDDQKRMLKRAPKRPIPKL
ncbi:von Willebrand factor type A domain-containing protein [Neorhodopirellula lusitana]|uniref:von Willebrand factor type A domain-containing protein n=1 Tax=Neorhodopirellula lusitana TaxID=445327 RepID=A0ABY1PP36_9BACT|nr:vWA domain-containing protein [Neorhodopirellula lusitana]SMP40594.1 von Willebrand factor type A domain-containing protein [Neorhodopirellula lusitana]